MMLKWLVTAVIVYGGFVALLYLAQRLFQYFPERRRTAPSAVGLTKAEEVVLDTADGERVIVWHVPPCGGQPVFVYFHGNGGSLRWREERFRDLIADGSGLVALSYRGYGGSSGHPTEKGLIEDAKAAYAFSAARYPAERLVLWGESLGSALALSLAAENPVGRVVLDGVFIYSPEGKLIGRIHLPERCANLCFGGAKRNRLFMAASKSLYSLYINTQGALGG